MTNSDLDLLRPRSIVVDAGVLDAHSESDATPSPVAGAKRKMPTLSLPNPRLKLDPSALKGALSSLQGRSVGRGSRAGRKGATLVGLDVQPGYVAAVQARVNGSILVQRAAGAPLPADTVRDGEVLDEGLLAEALRELFQDSRLDRRVRIGVANQRTVLRTLELPPLTDRKELATAVRFQAEDQIPMPLENAVLDFHPLGIVETPAGPRQRVIVVAAQRDMVEKLLAAVRRAGLHAGGVDLSAFALIRSLCPAEAQDAEETPERTLYLNVGGLTNMAIAEGPVCRFTRVVGGGLESMAVAVAERHTIALVDARALIAAADLSAPPATEPVTGPDARGVLEGGVRDIAGEVRNSLDFHRSQEGGGEVASVVLSGPALQITGFAQALERELGVSVRSQTVGLLASDAAGSASADHLAIAAGLAVEEAPR